MFITVVIPIVLGAALVVATWNLLFLWARSHRAHFILTAAALGIAAFAGAGISWDGSYILFRTINEQTQAFDYQRFSHILFEWPQLVLSRITDNLGVLRTVAGLSYATLPLAALAVSWWVVHDRAPRLFVWAAMGIGIATLPGQFCFICEGVISVHLFWPLLLAVLVGPAARHIPMAAVFAPLLFFFHPVAAVLFAVGAVAALGTAIIRRDRDRPIVLWSLSFLLLALLAFLRLSLAGTGYEAGQLSAVVQWQKFQRAVLGLPLAAISAVWIAGALLLISRSVKDGGQSRALRIASLTGILVAGGFLLYWAVDPERWSGVIAFRTLALFSSLPLMVFAFLDARLPGHGQTGYADTGASFDRLLVKGVGAVFFIVLAAQSAAFVNLSNQTMAHIADTAEHCVSRSEVETVKGTALDHWSFTLYALLLQERTPQKLVLDEAGCIEAAGTGSFRLVPWQWWEYDGQGWFDLRPARSRIEVKQSCVLVMSLGWHEIEQSDSGWSMSTAGRGYLRGFAQQAQLVTLTGELASLLVPNQVDILLNGERQRTIGLENTAFQPFEPIPLQLLLGENIIEFLSQQVSVSASSEPIAITVRNLDVATPSNLGCELLKPQRS